MSIYIYIYIYIYNACTYIHIHIHTHSGYFISAPASAIIAQPGTLTGSIGVVGGKFVIARFLSEKIGINFGILSRGQRAGVLSGLGMYLN